MTLLTTLRPAPATASRVRVKAAGTMVVQNTYRKEAGVFVARPLKVKVGGVFV